MPSLEVFGQRLVKLIPQAFPEKVETGMKKVCGFVCCPSQIMRNQFVVIQPGSSMISGAGNAVGALRVALVISRAVDGAARTIPSVRR